MNTFKFDKPHLVLLGTMIVLLILAGFVSHASTKATERAIIASATDVMASQSSGHRWEFLRDGTVLGRILSGDEAVYVFTLRLFGGDYRYAITMQDNGQPKAFVNLGTGPVSPHAARIASVMKAHVGERLKDRSALDAQIAHAIMASIQTIAIQERSRKEASIGE
jgi:hypothetical protein